MSSTQHNNQASQPSTSRAQPLASLSAATVAPVLSATSGEDFDQAVQASEQHGDNVHSDVLDEKDDEAAPDEVDSEATLDGVNASRDGAVFTNCDEIYHSFDDMGLSEELLRGVYGYGFEKPSIIQQRAIVPMSTGRDIIAQAQSGCGKTAAFTIGSLAQIDPNVKGTQVIMLSPTRELAKQSIDVVKAISSYMNITSHACVGGTIVQTDIQKLRAGAQVVVGTPGRIISMMERGHLDVSAVKCFILDEADEMLDRGFRDQIYSFFSFLPSNVQACLFSATMPPEALEISKKFMRDPIKVLLKADQLTLDGIKQFYVDVGDHRHKPTVLMDLYSTISVTQAIIYVNTRRRVEWLTDILNQNEFTVSSIHGEMTPQERELVMQEFKSGSSRVLITTDLLARGIDVQSVSLVINFDLPRVVQSYLHRIGRSGRFGRKGVAINFIGGDDDVQSLREIEKYYHSVTKELPSNISELL